MYTRVSQKKKRRTLNLELLIEVVDYCAHAAHAPGLVAVLPVLLDRLQVLRRQPARCVDIGAVLVAGGALATSLRLVDQDALVYSVLELKWDHSYSTVVEN